MATQADYTASANAILAVLNNWVAQKVPPEFQGDILPVLPALSGAAAKASVDAVDTERVIAQKVRDN